MHSAIFEIDNQQGLNIKKINFESKIFYVNFQISTLSQTLVQHG